MFINQTAIEVIPVFHDARLLATDDVASESHRLQSNSSIRRKLQSKITELFNDYIDPNAERSVTNADVANEPVIGNDPYDTEGVELAQAWLTSWFSFKYLEENV